jgi:hypothetical protein
MSLIFAEGFCAPGKGLRMQKTLKGRKAVLMARGQGQVCIDEYQDLEYQ